MSYPILYSATETKFDHNGIGILSACVTCEVTEEANGAFELAMQYPMDGIHYEDISDRSIIKAKADQFREPQLFRIYAISKPMNGIVTVLAEHISYDLSGIPVKPFYAESVSHALAGIKNNAIVDCPFEFWTDKSTAAKFTVSTPASIRSRLGGVAGSILDVYGGEYEFDNYTVKLHNNRGMNRGVSIRYGKNLTDIQQEQNCSNVATGVYPYWVDSEGNNLVELPEKIINAPGTYNFVKIKTLDLSQVFESKPTEEQIRTYTENYVKNNDIGVPNVSLTVSFAQLEQHDEYKHLKLLERVSLFDTVNVEFPALGVSATAKAVKIVYDAIADRVKSATLGSVRANIADTIVEQKKEIEKKPSVSVMQSVLSNLTSAILGAKGGSVRLLDENGDGSPDTLYIADDPDPALAVKVWRFNYEGWGASKNGYNGPFELGATLEDGLLANFVTAAQLVAGTIKSQDNGQTFFLDLDNGILNMKANSLSIEGKTVDEIAKDSVTIGGTNLLTGTKDFSGSDWQNIGMWTSSGEYKGFSVMERTGAWQGLKQVISVEAGDVYTMSAYIKASGSFQFESNIGSGGSGASTNNDIYTFTDVSEWTRIVNTFTVTKAGTLMPGWEGTTDSTKLWICGMKLEKGNKATDWSPAPSDNALSQSSVFNALTNNGALKGIFMENGELYINADLIKTGVLASRDGSIQFNVENGYLSTLGKSLNFEETHELRIDNDGLYIHIRDANNNLVGSLDLGVVDGLLNGEPWRSIQISTSRGAQLSISGNPLYLGDSSNETKIYGSPVTVSGEMHTGTINPGKTSLFTGNVTRGNTCSVPNTDRYDLFAIKLGDASKIYDTVVLAYKTGNVVRGVGGWAGTETESKQLFFLSATVSGNKWTLEDAGYHYVYIGGTVEEGIRLNLREIIGII